MDLYSDTYSNEKYGQACLVLDVPFEWLQYHIFPQVSRLSNERRTADQNHREREGNNGNRARATIVGYIPLKPS